MNMKTRLITVVSAVAVSCLTLVLSNTAVAQMKEGGAYQNKTRRDLTRAKFLNKVRVGPLSQRRSLHKTPLKSIRRRRESIQWVKEIPITPMGLSTVPIHPGPGLTAHRSPTVVLF